MTFGSYIKAMNATKVFHCSRIPLAKQLLNAAGINPGSDANVAKWIDRKVPDNIHSYLVDENVKDNEVLKYFRRQTRDSWKPLQQGFTGKENCIVDFETDDKDAFYQSLLNQFLLSLGFPISEDETETSSMYMLRHRLPEKPVIFGRDHELEAIANILSSGNYAVATGIGGIGKSHVALAYAHSQIEETGLVVQHTICEDTDSLRDAIAQLQFGGLPEDDGQLAFDRRIYVLQAHRQPLLIILDNLNRQFSQEDQEVFQTLTANGNIRLLMTSRQALVNNKQCVVQIEPMSFDSLLELYAYHRFESPDRHRDYIETHRDTLKKMFDRVERHTLMIELLAKLPIRSGLNESQIYDCLDDGLNIPPAKVGITKDGRNLEDSIQEIVKNVFSISQFNETEKDIMRHMTLVIPSGIELKIFVELTGFSVESIIGLKNSNWIVMDEETFNIRLHPVICETILNIEETRPSLKSCQLFFDNLEKLMKSCVSENRFYDLQRTMSNAIRRAIFPAHYTPAILELFKTEYRDT